LFYINLKMNNSLSKGAMYLTISSIIFTISGYLVNIILGRSLGPVDYGIYGIIISLMTVVNIVQTAGLPRALSKYIAQDENNKDSILKSGLILQFISTAIITITFFLLSEPIALLLNDSSLTPYIKLSSLIFPFYGIYALYSGYYNGMHDFKKQALIISTYSIFKTISVVGLAFIFHIQGAIGGFIIAPLVALVSGIKFPSASKVFSYKKLILYSLPLLGFAFLSTLLQSVDLYFIKALSISDKDPGYYTANQNIARLPFFALSAFSLILLPSISKYVSLKENEKIREILHKSLRMTFLLIIPGTLLVSVTSGSIIHLLYSSEYLPAAPSLSILIFAFGFLTIFTILANILNGAGAPWKSLGTAALGLTFTAFSCLFMIPKYGLVGASLSTTIGSFAAMISAAYFVYQRFHALVPIKSTLKITLAALLIAAIAGFVSLPVALLPLLYVTLFIIYIFILVVFKEVTREDFKQLRSLLPFQ
jgi:stage V sporulation protein B